MKILITNDDGILSEGLYALAMEFQKDNEVYIIAPDSQRSASGHSITLNRPIIVKEVKLPGIIGPAYSTSGTPADCVKIGIEKIYTVKFDLLLSGINYGTNLGSDVIYSGTVSAAIEGSICKIPSIAISMELGTGALDYSIAAKYARKIIYHAINNDIKKHIILNINVPALAEEEIKGIKVSELGNRIYNNTYIETIVGNAEVGYLVKGDPLESPENCKTDVSNLKNGYVTVTPLHYDLTNFSLLKEVDSWFDKEYNVDKS